VSRSRLCATDPASGLRTDTGIQGPSAVTTPTQSLSEGCQCSSGRRRGPKRSNKAVLERLAGLETKTKRVSGYDIYHMSNGEYNDAPRTTAAIPRPMKGRTSLGSLLEMKLQLDLECACSQALYRIIASEGGALPAPLADRAENPKSQNVMNDLTLRNSFRCASSPG